MTIPWALGSWRQILAGAVIDIDELLRMLGLNRKQVGVGSGAEQIARDFGLRVPRGFIDLMQRGDANDPLLRQVLPVDDEARAVQGFNPDPLGEGALGAGGLLIQKYRGRSLILATSACAIHCRYCFRRHFSPLHYGRPEGGLAAALQTVASDPSLSEVILSGGDPLVLADDVLEGICATLEQASHLRRVRFHTRLPVILPERVDSGLLSVVKNRRLPVVMVVHANHSRELSSEVAIACAALAGAGVTLLNQSVLLAGVNDNADALVDLSERLFEIGVHPYYLHLLDRVAGAAHFDVPEDRARRLLGEVASRLPGYLVPRLVREEVGATAKTVVPPSGDGRQRPDSGAATDFSESYSRQRR